MDQTGKSRTLQSLNESRLRRDVIIPLLGRMGFRAVSEYHGPREHGKDIVCFDIDRLGERRYLAVVAKTRDLSGSVSADSGLLEVLHQAEQCFNEDYHDLFGMRTITMDEVWIVTSGRVVPGAADTIMGKLRKTNLAKLTRVVAGEQLVGLLDQHYPTYWQLSDESAETLRGQRDKLLAFVRNLLRTMGAEESSIASVLSAIINSPTNPLVQIAQADHHRIHNANAYIVQVAPRSREYARGLTSGACGDLEDALRKAQTTMQHELYGLQETLEAAERAALTPEPNEFLSIFSGLRDEYPFHKYGSHSDAVREAQLLADGVEEVDDFLYLTESAGKRDEFLALVAGLVSLEGTVSEFLTGVRSPEFYLAWKVSGRVITLEYQHEIMEEEGFITRHQLEIDTFRRWGPTTRRVTVRDIMEVAQLGLRDYYERRFLSDDNGLSDK